MSQLPAASRTDTRADPRGHLRRDLLDATERLLRTQGLATMTTRQIAREAGCSDGALYTHFGGKAELLQAVVDERLPDFRAALGELLDRVGAGSIEDSLQGILGVALDFFHRLAPISSSIGGEPELMLGKRAGFGAQGGPRVAYETLAAYLRAEQRGGRIDAAVDCVAAATVLVGACHNYALVQHVFGESQIEMSDQEYAAAVVRTVVAGLAPRRHHSGAAASHTAAAMASGGSLDA